MPRETYEDEAWCDHCDRDTRQRFHFAGHERDSSNDRRECLVCHWYRLGSSNEWSPPIAG